MADWVTGKVTKVQNWTDALFSLTVHAPVLPFTAGQFTKLGLEIDGEPDCETLWMLATGTAIGPYLSILQLGKDLDRFKNLVLVHAARYTADLSYLPLMQELEKRYEGKLRIQTVVSRETAAGSLTGRIPALIESGELESAIGLPMNKETSHVMLCGNPQMVRDTQQLLKETRQMTKHLRRRPGHMTAEHYW